jgi:hypothetical protein
MIAAAIDTTALVKMAVSSLVAGVGVTVVFSFAILGAIRSSDMRREHRSAAATAYAALAAAGIMAAVAITVYGLVLVAHKS